jgi:threonine aldolase
MVPRISIDHKNAKYLGNGLSKINGLKVDTSKIHTNIVTGSVEALPVTIENFLSKLLDKGIKAKRISKTSFRMVTHYGIDEQDLQYVIDSIQEIVTNL